MPPDHIATPASSAASAALPADKTSFSLEYVQELRAENAKYRTKAGEAHSAALAAQQAAETRLAEVSGQAAQRVIRAELKAEAVRAGMVDLDGLKLADWSALTLDEHGEVPGAADVMRALKEAKPYLFGVVSTTSQTREAPRRQEPKAFNAKTATPEELAARARELGVKIKTH